MDGTLLPASRIPDRRNTPSLFAGILSDKGASYAPSTVRFLLGMGVLFSGLHLGCTAPDVAAPCPIPPGRISVSAARH